MRVRGFIDRWIVLVAVLVLAIIAGGTYIALKYRPAPGIEISLEFPPALQGTVYVGGEVNNPGLYPLRDGDTVDDVIASAGGIREGTAAEYFELIVSGQDDATPQKININRAEAWLLEALPGIGPTRAADIVAYREAHGLFRDIYELLKVPGIGESTLADIEALITVGD